MSASDVTTPEGSGRTASRLDARRAFFAAVQRVARAGRARSCRFRHALPVHVESASLLQGQQLVRAPLDPTPWSDELIGGRVVRVGKTWLDMAAAVPVTLRAWLIDEGTARRWRCAHGDALDAWVLSRGVGWIGMRVDLDVAWAAEAWLGTPVSLPAGLCDAERSDTVLPWSRAAVVLRRAGVVPAAPPTLHLLASRPVGWWGTVAVAGGPGDLDRLARVAVERFAASGGRVHWLHQGRTAGRSCRQERHTMRETELLDVLDRLEQASDDREALMGLCGFVMRRLGAASAGASRSDGQEVIRLGDGAAASAGWAAGVREASGGLQTPESARVVSTPVHDAAGVVGTLWASWPLADDVPSDASRVLGVCARIAASRLAGGGLAGHPSPTDMPRLIGDGALMAGVRAQLARAARSPFPILLLGESGSGKELAARTVHEAGARRGRRYVTVNCAALPDDLLDAEFFGHARGAYTGAVGERAGVFEEADGGTLFLDEVGDLSLRAQAKLLRVLQEGEVRRLGETGVRRVDARVIAATNVPLEDAVDAGQFRADLYYRLAVVCVRLPPLRERRDDIPRLVAHLWAECARRVGTQARLHPSLVDALVAHDWPGNVRELQNVLATLAVDAPRRGVVLPTAPLLVRRPTPPAPDTEQTGLDDARRQFDAVCVREALARAGGRQTVAARNLGLSRQGLAKLVRRLGLHPARRHTSGAG